MKEWKVIKKHEKSFNRHCARTLADYIKNHPSSYPSDIEELLEICKIKVDMESVKKYHKFHSFLVKHRKMTMTMFERAIENGDFKKYKDEGIDEKEIYQRFIDTCLSYEILPLYCDVDGRYKVCDLYSYLEMINARLKATGSELKEKFGRFETMNEVLPEAVNDELLLLQDDFQMLKDTRDHLNKYLPESKGETT